MEIKKRRESVLPTRQSRVLSATLAKNSKTETATASAPIVPPAEPLQEKKAAESTASEDELREKNAELELLRMEFETLSSTAAERERYIEQIREFAEVEKTAFESRLKSMMNANVGKENVSVRADKLKAEEVCDYSFS